jgi:hypothetical protein
MDETEKNHRPATIHWHILEHVYRMHLAWAGFELTTLVVIGIDCIGSYNIHLLYGY